MFRAVGVYFTAFRGLGLSGALRFLGTFRVQHLGFLGRLGVKAFRALTALRVWGFVFPLRARIAEFGQTRVVCMSQ